jgi:hypothetical protein
LKPRIPEFERAERVRALDRAATVIGSFLKYINIIDEWGRGGMNIGKPAGKRPLGRPIRRWVDNIKMDLREVGWDGRDWIDLAQDRDRWRAHVNAMMNLRVP